MALVISLASSTADTTLAGLRALLRSRWGFKDASDNECDSLLNQAYLELCEREEWPFLEADATGAAPLTIDDLRKVNTVRETTSGCWLERSSRQRIVTLSLDPSTEGQPDVYYIDAGNVIRTFPVGGELAVRYWKVPDELASSADVPLVPARFRDIIVTGAARIGLMADSASEDVQFVTQEYERRISVMAQSLLVQDSEPGSILLLDPGDDYRWA